MIKVGRWLNKKVKKGFIGNIQNGWGIKLKKGEIKLGKFKDGELHGTGV